jgi:hypothetical protein
MLAVVVVVVVDERIEKDRRFPARLSSFMNTRIKRRVSVRRRVVELETRRSARATHSNIQSFVFRSVEVAVEVG